MAFKKLELEESFVTAIALSFKKVKFISAILLIEHLAFAFRIWAEKVSDILKNLE